MQDVLVGRKWQGSDIPTSILEAAELFSGRMVATRALKQLWEERVEFMKFERGWTGAEDDEDVRPMKLESSEEEKKADELPNNYDGSVTERLQAVENFYVSTCLLSLWAMLTFLREMGFHISSLLSWF